MTEPRIDPERLAALLDGRLAERERAEVLERLAADDEMLEVYADAAAVTRELEGSDAAARPEPPRRLSRPSWWRGRGPWLAAAVLAAVALVPWMWSRTRAPEPFDPARVVAVLDADAGLPDGWDGGPWAPTRGAEASLSPDARAVRLGASLVDLRLAARGGDRAGVGAAALRVESLLEGVPGAEPTRAVFREVRARVSGGTGEVEPLIARGAESAARLAGEERVALGAWLEAARVAAARGDADFFREPTVREALAEAAELAGDDISPGDLQQIRRTPESGDAPEWDRFKHALAELLRALGS